MDCFVHLLACNCAKYSPIYFFSPADNNKSFLIWLLATPPHLKYVATLPCNSSLIACFLTLTFHKVVWRRYASAGASYDLVSVCLSVCLCVTSQSSGETDERIELFFGTGASFDLSYTVNRKFGYLLK